MNDPEREAVKTRLEALGFKVDIVPEVAGQKRPDLVASRGKTITFVEVKARVEDGKLRPNMESVGVGATKSFLTSLDKNNSISAQVERANAQLRGGAAPGDFRVLWFRAHSGPFIHDALEQIGATLVGIRMVLAERRGVRRARACLYAGNAEFFRCREIDGAMVEVEGALTMFVNQFSARYDAFARSPICAAVSPAIVDPPRMSEDVCYVVDADVDRRDDEAILGFLRGKYADDAFAYFMQHRAGTTVTAIDARSKRGV